MWTVDVMFFDPGAREWTFKVKIVAAVPPDAILGAPVRPVLLEGLTVTPYLNETGNGRARVAYSPRSCRRATLAGVGVGVASWAACCW